MDRNIWDFPMNDIANCLLTTWRHETDRFHQFKTPINIMIRILFGKNYIRINTLLAIDT